MEIKIGRGLSANKERPHQHCFCLPNPNLLRVKDGVKMKTKGEGVMQLSNFQCKETVNRRKQKVLVSSHA